MKTRFCCRVKPSDQSTPGPSLTRLGTIREIAAWLIPGATLALIPKCPLCVASYVALATGVGLSLPAAAFLRTGLITISIILLTFLSLKRLRFVLRCK